MRSSIVVGELAVAPPFSGAPTQSPSTLLGEIPRLSHAVASGY
jgi:hypothetical protein